MAENSKPTHLEPSQLGTKAYWDALYTRELSNHTSDPSDVGTIWFDDSSAEDKMVSFIRSLKDLNLQTTSFLDSGTGNGHMLFRLREEMREDGEDWDEEEAQIEGLDGEEKVFKGRMLGTDYSTKSIEFAKQVAENKGLGKGSEAKVEFVEWDILKSDPEILLTGKQEKGWDVVLDKGTFDAISLSDETNAQGRRIVEGYKERIVPLMRKGGRLLVTSCNWTEDELKGWFHDEEEGGLRFERQIEYRSFSFGGQKGQTISSCCFIKQ